MKQELEIGHSVLYAMLGEKAVKMRVINRLGNYVILENGIRFHILDDRRGEGIWYVDALQATITDQNQNY